MINSTGSVRINRAADLMTLRLATLNQILDPWVYILFRREALAKLSAFIRKRRNGSLLTRLASITSSFRSNATDIGNHRNHDIDNRKPAVSSQQQHLTAEINQNGEIKEPEVDNTDVNDVFIPIKNE